MSATTVEIEEAVDELLLVLDQDIQHIQGSLLRLNELRSLVVRRNDADLGKLLESIQAESDSYRSHESKRASLRRALAHALDCGTEDVTLSKLEAVLTGNRRAKVTAKKSELRRLTEELRKEHLSTAMLLSDCARFNRQLLKSVFELGEMGIISYDSKGSTRTGITKAFVDMQF